MRQIGCSCCTVVMTKSRRKQSSFASFSMQVSANLHNFRFRVPELHFRNLSNRCRHKYDPSISRFFWIPFLAGFWNLAQLCTGWLAGIHGESLRARGLRLFYEALLWVGNDACKQPKGKAVWGRGLTINLLFFLMFFKTASSKKVCAKNKFCQIIWVPFFTLWFHNLFQLLFNIVELQISLQIFLSKHRGKST